MARIDKIIDANKKLTIYELQGELSTEEMLRLNEEFHTGSSARNIIFDVMDGSLKRVTTDEIQSNIINSRTEKHKERKIAIVGKEDVDFGIGRMYTAYVEMEYAEVSTGVFRTRLEALKWLDLA